MLGYQSFGASTSFGSRQSNPHMHQTSKVIGPQAGQRRRQIREYGHRHVEAHLLDIEIPVLVQKPAVLGAAETPLNDGPLFGFGLVFIGAAGKQSYGPQQPTLRLLIVFGVAVPAESYFVFQVAASAGHRNRWPCSGSVLTYSIARRPTQVGRPSAS